MSVVLSLLHDAGENIVIGVSYPQKDGQKKRPWCDYLYTEPKKAHAFAMRKNSDRNANIYVKHANHNGRTGENNRVVSSEDNYIGSRTFFVDIDYKGKRSEAYNNLKNAIKNLNSIQIPPPNLIIDTGGGIHVAWVLDTVIEIKEWKRINDLFFVLLEQKGKLNYDRQAKYITNSIRIEGACNYNHDNTPFVRVLSASPRIIYTTFIEPINNTRPKSVILSNRPDYIGEANQDEFKEYNTNTDDFIFNLPVAVDHCLMLKGAIKTGGAFDSRKEWIDKLTLVAKGADKEYARDIAHRISKGHPTYDDAEVDTKFDGFANGSVKKTTRCETFYQHLNSVCPQCAWYQKVNSPAGIAYALQSAAAKVVPTVIQSAVAQPIPQPAPIINIEAINTNDGLPNYTYYNTPAGIRRNINSPDNPNPVVWADVRISNVTRRIESGGSNELLVFQFGETNENQRTITIPANKASDSKTLAIYLADNYMIIYPDTQRKNVQNIMTSWISSLQKKREQLDEINKEHVKMGWNDNMEVFAVGDMVYGKNNTARFAQLTNTDQRKLYVATGSASEQTQIINNLITNDTRPEAHAFIATAFAAPLLKLSGNTGMSINFYSGYSGHGKSTLAKSAASIWGKPGDTMLRINDTNNAISKRATFLNNLPGYLDELRGEDTRARVTELIFRVSEGKEKNRLNANATMQDAGVWQTTLVFSTNFSFAGLIDRRKAQGDAAFARFIDFSVGPLPDHVLSNTTAVQRSMGKLDNNYGHIGHAYAQYLVKNVDTLEIRLEKMIDRFKEKLGVSQENIGGRNQATIAACILLGTEIAVNNNYLNLNPSLVMAALIEALTTAKRHRKEAREAISPLNILGDFIRANSLWMVRTGLSQKSRIVIHDPKNLQQIIKYEIDQSSKELIIDRDIFMGWVSEQGHAVDEIMKEMRRLGYDTNLVRCLAYGTRYSQTERRVLIIDLKEGTRFHHLTLINTQVM